MDTDVKESVLDSQEAQKHNLPEEIVKAMQTWTPSEFVDLIDEKFLEHSKVRNSRYSLEWGMWSKQMNVVLRSRIDTKTDEWDTKLKLVVNYWFLVSEIVQFIHRSRYLKVGQRKKRQKDRAFMRRIIKREGKHIPL